MELLMIVTALVATLGAFGLLAASYGNDSRDRIPDDWTGPASI